MQSSLQEIAFLPIADYFPFTSPYCQQRLILESHPIDPEQFFAFHFSSLARFNSFLLISGSCWGFDVAWILDGNLGWT
ncbi:hypothetical protein SLE2022_365860 [Rubroshorea leprosula]